MNLSECISDLKEICARSCGHIEAHSSPISDAGWRETPCISSCSSLISYPLFYKVENAWIYYKEISNINIEMTLTSTTCYSQTYSSLLNLELHWIKHKNIGIWRKYTKNNGEKIERYFFTKKKNLPKCISGHKESFKTNLFLGENRECTPILSHFPYFCQLWPKCPEICGFF